MSALSNHVLQLQDRDLALLRSLFECRVMTTSHAAVLHFEGKPHAANKRLQKLKAAQFISERPRRAFDPAVLLLTRKGLDLLQERGVLREYPPLSLTVLEQRARVSELTIRHELEVMEVKTAFHAVFASSERFSLKEFSTWPRLHEFKAFRAKLHGTETVVKPDGFVRIQEMDPSGDKFEHTFFLEVDLSTESQDILVSRAGCYLDYFKSGGFAVRNGGTRSEFKDYPFRVLMVFKTAERRNNTAERLLQHNPPILSMVCLATLDEVKTNPLGGIWIRPSDYRDAVKGSPFETTVLKRTEGYRRQTERDAFVAGRLKPFQLLS